MQSAHRCPWESFKIERGHATVWGSVLPVREGSSSAGLVCCPLRLSPLCSPPAGTSPESAGGVGVSPLPCLAAPRSLPVCLPAFFTSLPFLFCLILLVGYS